MKTLRGFDIMYSGEYNVLDVTLSIYPIEILDLECVLGHVTGVQIENINALIS